MNMSKARTAENVGTGARTPGPWHLSGVRRKWYQADDLKHVCDSHAICLPNGEAIALVLYDPKQHAACWNDAAFIVKACNAHDDLVAALESAIPLLIRLGDYIANKEDRCEAILKARAALAKVSHD